MAIMHEPLFGFDGAFLQRLERLSLLNRRPVPGPTAGARRSPRHGSSVEFADFRDYSPGDDFRRIDWSAYARLDRLFLRLYSAEEMTTLTLLLDHSSSMGIGSPPKGRTAAQLAAMFSFIALHSYDRVAVLGWGEKIDHYLPAQAGKTGIPRVWRSIAQIMTHAGMPTTRGAHSSSRTSPAKRPVPEATDFTALRDFGAFRRGPGLAVVFSDFLTDTDWRSGLCALRANGQEVTALQILAPEELLPSLRGDWKLRDIESGALVDVTISPRVLRRYEEQLAAHTAALRDFCHQQGITFVQLPSDASLAEDALTRLCAAGVIG